MTRNFNEVHFETMMLARGLDFDRSMKLVSLLREFAEINDQTFAQGYTKAQQDIDVDLDAAYDEGYRRGYYDGEQTMQARAEGWE